MSTYLSNTVPVSTVTGPGTNSIDSLIGGVKWGGGVGTPISLTYSFPDGFFSPYWFYWSPDYDSYCYSEPRSYRARQLSSTEKSAATAALSSWSAVANINFTLVPDNESTVGDIRFAWTDNGPNAQAECKSLIRLIAGQPIDESTVDETIRCITRARLSQEGHEGMVAFLEKRKPTWVTPGASS